MDRATYMRLWRLKNLERATEIAKKSYEKHRDVRTAYMREVRAADPEKARAEANRRHALRMQDPVQREKHRLHCRHHRAKGRVPKGGIHAFYEAQVRAFYDNCPEGKEVDHMHPLKHPDFCGLHVPWNLQYLSKIDNRRKGRKLGET